ncbi:MAG: pyridoxamine 5'-phosphate oxidase family protein [Bacteroidia bacterium]
MGFVHEGYPVVIPTAYGRKGNSLYLHGANSSRMMKNLKEGVDVCVTVTHEHGLVLAKSAFHHSMNYASVVVFGKAVEVAGTEEKNEALKAISDHLLAGRWEEVRPPNAKELKATMVLALPIEEAWPRCAAAAPAMSRRMRGWISGPVFCRSTRSGAARGCGIFQGEIPDSVHELVKSQH